MNELPPTREDRRTGAAVPGTNRLEPLLSTQDLAEYLDIPLATLYAWRYRGDGPPSFRVGRHLRYRISDVEQWIDDQATLTIRRHGKLTAERNTLSGRW
jgi:excisionase family DNA binding protein